ncbi:ATP-binding protein [Promicromonospora alba]|uniref:histidine kinase n=1 Tax=Promicromonospora alba TaxID=1616110 RepID=A0ABV9HCE0_9MICO
MARPQESWAVFIGVGKYDDANLPDVPEVREGALALRDVLIDPDGGGLLAENCLIVPEDATREEVADTIVKATRKATDLLLIYYAGHGTRGWDKSDLVLSVRETNPERAGFSGIRFDDLRGFLSQSGARAKVVILDCCLSGRAVGQPLAEDGGEIGDEILIDGVATMTSVPANADAVVKAGEKYPAYTKRLIDILENGVPEADEFLTLSEIKNELRRHCARDGLRPPQARIVDQVDRLALALNRSFTPTAETIALTEALAAHELLSQQAALLEQFALTAASSLQKPLGRVASFTQLLKKRYGGQLDERADQYIEFAVDGVMQMQQLIQSLLMLSRAGSANVDEGVELSTVMEAVLHEHSYSISECNATIDVDPMPVVLGNRLLLQTALSHLISNALKFREPSRQPEIKVEVRSMRAHWEMSVVDNGIGVAAEDVESVFVMFHRLHPTEAYSGDGIGLPLVKRVVELHGGRIWLESGHRLGSTVRFTLRRANST